MKGAKWFPVILVLLAIVLAYVLLRRHDFSLRDLPGLIREAHSSREEDSAREIDFLALWENNPDIYAWIYVPGTIIDYPILQSKTDDFYLTHDEDRDENIFGAIYSNKINNKMFTDTVTVLYGHNMRDGSMFGELKRFLEPDFFKAHSTIYIYTPEKKLEYEVVAAYLYEDTYLFDQFDFTSEDGTTAYLDSIRTEGEKTSCIRNKKVKTPILTLSTCASGLGEKRVLVQAAQSEIDMW